MKPARRELLIGATSLAIAASGPVARASTASARRRIIDVHMHAYPADFPLERPANPVSGHRNEIRSGADHLSACVAEMRRHNIVQGVVSGGNGDRLGAALAWREHAPDLFIAGAALRGSADAPLPPLETLRAAAAQGRIQVLGEVTAQYAGRSLSDPEFEPYLALAEALDLPVALHTGMMPEGTPFDPCCRSARAALGRPSLVEEALGRHPKLRINLMHAGWPYLEDTIAILATYPNVNVDTGALNWLAPRPAFHRYLEALMDADFGERIMFGSDHMFWPNAIGLAIEGVDSAPFLSERQKQDIFFHNAARFFRLPG